MTSYTGIKEIDDVLLDLYDELATIEKKLGRRPFDRKLSERHRRLIQLQTRLLSLGKTLNVLDMKHFQGTPDVA